MSLLKRTTSPLSSPPSGQYVRRTSESNIPSRPQSIIDRPMTAQKTHNIPEEPLSSHETTEHPTSHLPEDDRHHESPSTAQPPFQPFFTLIEDANTTEYYHPTVHYIFSDDDTDILTEAALRSLETEQDALSHGTKGRSKTTHNPLHSSGGKEDTYDEDDDISSPRKAPLLPPSIPGVRDSYIILDVDSTSSNEAHLNIVLNRNNSGVSGTSPGTQAIVQTQQPLNSQNQHSQDRQGLPSHQFTVTSARSLTPAWQVLNTELVPAPTFENNLSGEQPLNGGLMLKIQGTAGLPRKDRDREKSSQRLEDMMDQFSKRLSELRQVIEAGEQGNFADELTEEIKPTELGTENTPGVSIDGQFDTPTQAENATRNEGAQHS
ncbi:hypothetical protein EYZ11_000400 [Aspergillus tanneri]|uniref:Anaphase promoting complex subunit 11 n=1 Tax=Aspergillus tanneri TaxID=1220188 RepID=A0A4S3JX39_9EURO|nr:uncharacterized protein ATNIH1004_006797 [Aspergillus tanneri]KAA8645378.1 hypothetical protein ATNIH1004_006797 [Aspergillus tanneri]THD00075.1 hypothetical protein EYZ11_000400 [Aspergillus tanneri]